MRADIFRKIVYEEAGDYQGLPDDIDQPELLLKALLQHVLTQREADTGKRWNAELAQKHAERRCEAMQEATEAMEKSQKAMASELAVQKRKVGDFEAKIAFLGKKWEELTGDVNNMLSEDPHTRAKQCKAEAEACKTLLYNTELDLKMRQRKADLLAQKCKEQDDAIARWTEQVLSSNKRSLETEQQNNRMMNEVTELRQKLASTTAKLEASETQLREVKGNLKLSDLRLQDTTARAEELNIKVVKVARDLKSSEASLGESKAIIERSTEDRSGLQIHLQKIEDELARTKTELASVKASLKAKEEEAKRLESDLQSRSSQLNNMNVEFEGVKEVNNRLTKHVNQGEIKLKEEKAELGTLRAGYDKMCSELAALGLECQNWKDKAEALSQELGRTKNQLHASEAQGASLAEVKCALDGKLITATAEFQQLQVASGRFEKELINTHTNLKSAEERIAQLSASVGRSAEEISELRLAKESVEAERKRLQSELERTSRELSAARDEIKGLQSTFKKTEADLVISQKNLETAGNTVQVLSKDVRSRSAKISEYEEELHMGNERMDKLAIDLERSDARLQEVLGREKQLAESLKAKEAALSHAEESVKVLTVSNDRLSFEMAVLRKQKDLANEQGRKVERAAASREEQIELKDEEIQNLQGKYDSLSGDYQVSQQHLAKELQETQRLAAEVEDLRIKLARTEELAADRERIYNRAQGELSLARQDFQCIDAMAKEKDRAAKQQEMAATKLQNEVSQYQTTNTEITDRLRVADKTVKDMTEEIRSLQEQLVISRSEATTVKATVGEYESTARRATQELEASQVRLREADIVVRKLTSEVRMLKDRLTDSDTERSLLSNNVNRLMEEFRKLHGVKAG